MRHIHNPLELWICSNLSKAFTIRVPTLICSGPCEDDFKLAEAMAKRENEAAEAVHVKLELGQDRGCPEESHAVIGGAIVIV